MVAGIPYSTGLHESLPLSTTEDLIINEIANAAGVIASASGVPVPPKVLSAIARKALQVSVGGAKKLLAPKKKKSMPKRVANAARALVPVGRPNPKNGLGPLLTVPVNTGRQRVTVPPVTRNLPNGDLLVEYREYVTDMAGLAGGNFNNLGFGIAADNVKLFPWLAGVARRYESYKFDKLHFEFETSAPTGARGSLMLSVDFDATDPAPVSKSEVLQSRNAVRTPVWAAVTYRCEREDLNKRASFFTKRKSTDVTTNLNTVGFVNITTYGTADTNVVGELWVTYKVRLMTPSPIAATGEALNAVFSGSDNTAPFGTNAVGGDAPVTWVSSTGTTTSVNTFSFNRAWTGIAIVRVTGVGLTASTPSGTGNSSEVSEVIDSAATSLIAVYNLTMVPPGTAGATFILTLANTSISACTVSFYQGDTM